MKKLARWNQVYVYSKTNLTYYSNQYWLHLDGIIESNWTEMVAEFDQMNLREQILRGIYGYGFERPSAIQQQAIKPCISGK